MAQKGLLPVRAGLGFEQGPAANGDMIMWGPTPQTSSSSPPGSPPGYGMAVGNQPPDNVGFDVCTNRLDVKTRLFVYGALEQMGLGDLPSLKGLHG